MTPALRTVCRLPSQMKAICVGGLWSDQYDKVCGEEVNFTYPANSFKQEEERRDEKILCTKYVYCFNAPFFFLLTSIQQSPRDALYFKIKLLTVVQRNNLPNPNWELVSITNSIKNSSWICPMLSIGGGVVIQGLKLLPHSQMAFGSNWLGFLGVLWSPPTV